MTMESITRLRVLVLGPDCHPDRVSIPKVTYSHAAALAQLHDVTLVAGSPVEADLRRAQAPFRAIEVVRTPWLDRTWALCERTIMKDKWDTQVKTAFSLPFALGFEWRAWQQLRRRIFAGEFDVVLRLLPMVPTIPSPFAFFLRNGPIPFVIGPLNGGLPWPSGFSQLGRQREWISYFRNMYRFLPFARSTYRHAAAIIAASSQVYSEFAASYPNKLFFVPEPGIASSLCLVDPRQTEPGAKLELIFVGGLVPRKACDLAVRAAAPLLRDDRAHFTIIGDGPERTRIEQITRSLGIEKNVTFCGWISQAEVFKRLRATDIMMFPSIRDNGAGAIFEGLANGAVPVVVDFGGPGDIVHSEVGYKVALSNEDGVVSDMQKILIGLEEDRDRLNRLRQQGMSFARERLTWEAKAQSTTRVLDWAVGRGPKPDLPPPKLLIRAKRDPRIPRSPSESMAQR